MAVIPNPPSCWRMKNLIRKEYWKIVEIFHLALTAYPAKWDQNDSKTSKSVVFGQTPG